jgi:hypothetical protein
MLKHMSQVLMDGIMKLSDWIKLMFPKKEVPVDRTSEKLLFTLGALQVYEVLTIRDYKITRSIFWRDSQTGPSGYGPFNNEYEAMRHYEQILKSMNAPENKPLPDSETNLIRVNFMTKKRESV